MRQIAGREHDLRPHLGDKRDERLCDARVSRCAECRSETWIAQEPVCTARARLYTRRDVRASPEIFDDLYLGLRAGGALRKQRRGEELTEEEAEALGRWQRLSVWRKVVAIGAFAVGTFGLGFTLGGLVFGRWRKA